MSSPGFGLGLHLLAREASPEVARQVAQALEYTPVNDTWTNHPPAT